VYREILGYKDLQDRQDFKDSLVFKVFRDKLEFRDSRELLD